MNLGDYSRLTFDPRFNVRTVMVLQGRPLTDADLNEGSEATLRRIETEAIDVIGAQGAPLHGGGFRIAQSTLPLTPEEAADPRNAPNTAFTNLQNAPVVITAGRYYINGLQIENHQICGPLLLQPTTPPPRFISQPMPLPLNALAGDGTKLMFLRAVIDHQTAVEAPRLLDPALGDADTSARAIVSWQVCAMDAPAGSGCGDAIADWNAMVAPSSGRMMVSLNAAAPSTDPCQLTPGGGYVRPENLLYRVEVHDGTVARTCADGPRFQRDGLKLKVSRNNAMEVARIHKVTGNQLQVTPSSRDGLPTFRQGDWIELLDDGAEARGDASAGWTRVLDASGDTLTVASVTGAAADKRVRLWSFDILTAPANATDALALEDGLEVKLPTGGEFRRGDYWLIPARYAVGQEYWSGLINVALPPLGPRVEYARLAMVVLAAGAVQSVTDCRPAFEPLTELLSFQYAGGDGQTVSPVGPKPGFAPAKLRAGVRLGRKPVKGALVRFKLQSTPGQIARAASDPAPGPAQGDDVIASTDVDGIASVEWTLNLKEDVQYVLATLLDANDPTNNQTLPLRITYSAELNVAKNVKYNPGACTGLNGIDNVQSALDKLCNDVGAIKPPNFLRVKSVFSNNSVRPILNNEFVDPSVLAEGITVALTEPIGTEVQGIEPILRVWLDLPFPSGRSGRQDWRDYLNQANFSPIIGTVPLTLCGTLSVKAERLIWQPGPMAQDLLKKASKHRFGLNPQDDPPVKYDDGEIIKGYLCVRGDCVWATEDPSKYLNGEVLAKKGTNIFSMESKDLDPQRAADYRIWFFITV